MAEKRVIEYEAASELANDDWLLIDGVTEGTRKARANVVTAELGAQVTSLASTVGGLTQVAMGHEQSFAPSYDENASYDVGDLVMQYHCLYRCTAPTTGTWDAGKWARTEVSEQLAEARKVDDVKVDGVSVVDENKVAQITTPDADGISYDNTTSGLEADDVQEAIDEVVTDIESVETALEIKADVDGIYDELVAGNVMSDSYESDTSPYLYRASHSGSAVEEEIVGGTVAWNQIVENGNFTSTSGWLVQNSSISVSDNVATVTSNTTYTEANIVRTNIGIVKDHIYILSSEAKSDSEVLYKYSIYGAGSGTQVFSLGNLTNNFAKYQKLVKADGDKGNFYLSVTKSQASDLVVMNYKNVNIIDLTQAFGSTIADYIYSLEQATAGSGIAWLKSYGFLTKDYYAYDAGSLQSVKTSARKIVGKNIASVNSVTAGSGNVDIYNGIGIQSNITISFKCNNFSFTNAGASLVVIIDSDNQAHPITPSGFGLSVNTVYNNRVSGSFTINYKFKRIYIPTTGYTNISGSLDDIQIELGSTATIYEPYNPTTYSLSPIDLRGIPKLDSNNKLYYDGDIYESDGSVTRRFGVLDLSTAQAVYNSGWGCWVIQSISGAKIVDSNNSAPNVISNILTPTKASGYASSHSTNTIAQNTSGIWFFDNGSSTTKSGILLYELATPTSETAQPYTNPQLVGSTEEFVDAGVETQTRDVAVPVGHDSKYYLDIKGKVEQLYGIPEVPSTNGTYTLKATRSNSGVAYSWVSD